MKKLTTVTHWQYLSANAPSLKYLEKVRFNGQNYSGSAFSILFLLLENKHFMRNNNFFVGLKDT